MTDDEARETVAANLNRLRGDLSYAEIGRRADTSAGAIRDIALAERAPGVGLLTRIAEALGVTYDDLLKPVKKIAKSA